MVDSAASPGPAPDFVEAIGAGLYCIDTGFKRPRFDAAYLIVDAGRAAFIDTGTNHAVPRLLGALQWLGLRADAVDWVIPTHVHLDHAGGVGTLMQHLPGARLLVHPRGLRHMLDPSVLYEGALAVYGAAEMQRAYGRLIGVDAKRAQATHDGMSVHVGRRQLRFMHTPGHARHHHCIWDERSRGWFSGDTFGISYREFDSALGACVLPSTVPSQFEPDALRDSIQRLLAAQASYIYLTHFGRVGDVPRLGEELLELLRATVAIGLAQRHAAQRHQRLCDELRKLYLAAAVRHGSPLDAQGMSGLLEMDIELNAQGLGGWLDRGAST